jgi:hypothetical protein
MFEHPFDGDNHNAGAFAYCYGRLGDFIPELVQQGCNPRVMLDYSGTLLWGLVQMGRQDILDKLRRLACDPTYQPYVEWLGTCWGHAVVPSTPIPDLKLQIRAWQHQFASIFGLEAVARVRGFSPPEMHLPNHPDGLYAFVTTLKECGYTWLLVQEHTVETLEGTAIPQPHLPHRLVARNAQGDVAEMLVLIKTQGSDTKLVGQMQPYWEAKTLQPQNLGGVQVPPLVSQISDGENGGVMMNEFPSAFMRSWYEMREQGGGQRGVVGLNGTEYLELVAGWRIGPVVRRGVSNGCGNSWPVHPVQSPWPRPSLLCRRLTLAFPWRGAPGPAIAAGWRATKTSWNRWSDSAFNFTEPWPGSANYPRSISPWSARGGTTMPCSIIYCCKPVAFATGGRVPGLTMPGRSTGAVKPFSPMILLSSFPASMGVACLPTTFQTSYEKVWFTIISLKFRGKWEI